LNSLIVLPCEIVSPGRAVITGRRAEYVFDYHDLKPDISVRMAEMNGPAGQARILEVSRSRIVLQFEPAGLPPPAEPLFLIVAVPRPQTVKKVLQSSAMLGVQRIFFVQTREVRKSYLQSKSLTAENIQYEIIKGLEQSCTSQAPEVSIHRSLGGFLKNTLAPLLEAERRTSKPLCLLADTRSSTLLSEFTGSSLARGHSVFAAIGPEAGWTEDEVADWRTLGFEVVSLGARVLRVEIALAYLAGQINMLRR